MGWGGRRGVSVFVVKFAPGLEGNCVHVPPNSVSGYSFFDCATADLFCVTRLDPRCCAKAVPLLENWVHDESRSLHD